MDNQYLFFTEDTTEPYSDLVVVDGSMLYLSGLVSEDPVTRDEAYGDITFETKRILDNLAGILARYGSDMDHVVRIDVLLRDFGERNAMNEEYVKHFRPDHKPARLCYGGVDIAGDWKIEMAVIARKK